MNNQNILKSVIDLTKGQASMAFVTFIWAFAFIIRDVSKILGFKESPIVILFAIFFIIAVLIWRIAKFEKRRLPDLSDSQLFYPFLENISPDVRSNYLLETVEVGKDILEIIDQEKNRHFALVGNSGAGKTILLKNYVLSLIHI